MWSIAKLFIIITTTYVAAKRPFVIDIHDFRFNLTSPNYFKTFTYNLHQQKYITVEVILDRMVSQTELIYKFDMIKKDNKHIKLLSISIDGCKGLESRYSIPLIATITKELFSKSNLPKRCPIKPDTLYFLRNFTFNQEDYPKLTPTMTWQGVTEFYFDTQYQGNLLIKGQVRKV